MADALQPLEEVQIRTNKYLVIGIVASLVLHLACALFLVAFLGGSPSRHAASITYIDLKAIQHPAPAQMALPAKEPAPEPLPDPLEPPAQQTPPQAQTQQAEPAQPQAAQPQEPATPEDQLPKSTMGLGLTKGYFKSLSDGTTLRAGVKGYYEEMLQGINEKWWLDQQLDKRRLSPIVVSVTVARNGEIIGSQIMRSSGDRRFDRAVLAALTAASPLPPLPATYVGDTFEAPIRLVPPLNLMAW